MTTFINDTKREKEKICGSVLSNQLKFLNVHNFDFRRSLEPNNLRGFASFIEIFYRIKSFKVLAAVCKQITLM